MSSESWRLLEALLVLFDLGQIVAGLRCSWRYEAKRLRCGGVTRSVTVGRMRQALNEVSVVVRAVKRRCMSHTDPVACWKVSLFYTRVERIGKMRFFLQRSGSSASSESEAADVKNSINVRLLLETSCAQANSRKGSLPRSTPGYLLFESSLSFPTHKVEVDPILI